MMPLHQGNGESNQRTHVKWSQATSLERLGALSSMCLAERERVGERV